MGFFQNIWNGIKNAGKWVDDKVFQPIEDGIHSAVDWTQENVINPVGDWFDNLGDNLNKKAKDIYGASFTEIAETPSNIMHDIATGDLGDGIVSVIDKAKDNPIVKDIETGIGEKTIDIGNELAPLFGEEKLPEEELEKEKDDLLDKVQNGPMPENQGTGESDLESDVNEDLKSIFDEMRKNALEDQKRAWEREDKIRAEEYERQDSAYQRAIEDMRKAGINPELIGIQPAQSGGASVSTANVNDSANSYINSLTNIATSLIDKETSISENKKDRVNDILRAIITFAILKK